MALFALVRSCNGSCFISRLWIDSLSTFCIQNKWSFNAGLAKAWLRLLYLHGLLINFAQVKQTHDYNFSYYQHCLVLKHISEARGIH